MARRRTFEHELRDLLALVTWKAPTLRAIRRWSSAEKLAARNWAQHRYMSTVGYVTLFELQPVPDCLKDYA